MSREDTFDIMTGSITVDDYQRKLEHEFERRGLPPRLFQCRRSLSVGLLGSERLHAHTHTHIFTCMFVGGAWEGDNNTHKTATAW